MSPQPSSRPPAAPLPPASSLRLLPSPPFLRPFFERRLLCPRDTRCSSLLPLGSLPPLLSASFPPRLFSVLSSSGACFSACGCVRWPLRSAALATLTGAKHEKQQRRPGCNRFIEGRAPRGARLRGGPAHIFGGPHRSAPRLAGRRFGAPYRPAYQIGSPTHSGHQAGTPRRGIARQN